MKLRRVLEKIGFRSIDSAEVRNRNELVLHTKWGDFDLKGFKTGLVLSHKSEENDLTFFNPIYLGVGRKCRGTVYQNILPDTRRGKFTRPVWVHVPDHVDLERGLFVIHFSLQYNIKFSKESLEMAADHKGPVYFVFRGPDLNSISISPPKTMILLGFEKLNRVVIDIDLPGNIGEQEIIVANECESVTYCYPMESPAWTTSRSILAYIPEMDRKFFSYGNSRKAWTSEDLQSRIDFRATNSCIVDHGEGGRLLSTITTSETSYSLVRHSVDEQVY